MFSMRLYFNKAFKDVTDKYKQKNSAGTEEIHSKVMKLKSARVLNWLSRPVW